MLIYDLSKEGVAKLTRRRNPWCSESWTRETMVSPLTVIAEQNSFSSWVLLIVRLEVSALEIHLGFCKRYIWISLQYKGCTSTWLVLYQHLNSRDSHHQWHLRTCPQPVSLEPQNSPLPCVGKGLVHFVNRKPELQRGYLTYPILFIHLFPLLWTHGYLFLFIYLH